MKPVRAPSSVVTTVSGRLDNASQGVGFLDQAVPRQSLYLMSVRFGIASAFRIADRIAT